MDINLKLDFFVFCSFYAVNQLFEKAKQRSNNHIHIQDHFVIRLSLKPCT